jgi:acyl-coenzyme A synthetase/AMP-(fatty) acid ligase
MLQGKQLRKSPIYFQNKCKIFFSFPDLGDSSELCFGILQSSGTTGIPKFIAVSHAQLLENYNQSK